MNPTIKHDDIVIASIKGCSHIHSRIALLNKKPIRKSQGSFLSYLSARSKSCSGVFE